MTSTTLKPPRRTLSADGDSVLVKRTPLFWKHGKLRLVAEIADLEAPTSAYFGMTEQLRADGLGELKDRKHFFVLLNHDWQQPIAMNSFPGFLLQQHGRRLRFELPIIPGEGITLMAGWPDLIQSLNAYTIRGMSMGWRRASELTSEWRMQRFIHSADVREISILTLNHRPALPSWAGVYEVESSLSHIDASARARSGYGTTHKRNRPCDRLALS